VVSDNMNCGCPPYQKREGESKWKKWKKDEQALN
jgi:hypothetical protein